jgi:hypothetical protein
MATTLKRSLPQVIRGFLPDQTFEHPNETVGKVLWMPVGSAEVNRDVLMEALQERLEDWELTDPDTGVTVSRTSGFVKPATDHADEYAIVEPEGSVFYSTWPLQLRCTDQRCQRVQVYPSEESWKKAKDPASCTRCGGRLRQFEYMLVHNCGRARDLFIQPCPQHKWEHVYLHDTGLFPTSTWRCRAGAHGATAMGHRLSGMRAPGCSCSEPGNYRHVTMRQEMRLHTHVLKFVSFDPQPMIALRSHPGAGKVVIGSYLEYFGADWEQALSEVSKDRADLEAKAHKVRRLMELDGETPEAIEDMMRTIVGEAGGDFEDIARLVGSDVVAAIGSQQRPRERTLIWGEASDLSIWRLARFRQAAERSGRTGALHVLDAAEHKLADLGFSDLLVVDNFPVALAGFGYSRISRHPQQAILNSFKPLSGGGARLRGRTPIYCATATTEAVFFELDAERIIAWLVANDRLTVAPELPSREDALSRRRAAKAFMLAEQCRNPTVRELCFLLQHTMAHALIKNLGERSGFGEETMSEYLIPEMLTVGLFADVHQEVSLGALVALVEHRLAEWLDATLVDAEHCPWDPHCGEEDGACMACLHLAFSCDKYNGELNRAVLFGSAEGQELQVGYGYWETFPPLP